MHVEHGGPDPQRAAVAEVALSYTGDLSDPAESLYTLDYYLRLAEQIVTAGAHVLAIKDMAGLLRAPAASTLVSALKSRFDLPAMNALYERMLALPDGPEREALFDEAKRIAVAYMPEKTTVHRMFTYLNQPWLVGYRRKPFQTGWYQMVDLEPRMAP